MLESLKHEDLQFQELTPEEKQSRGILARLTGPIASFTKGTRNGRKYSDKLWEKAFDAPLVKEMFKNGGLPGELQHPEGRSETDPTKIAIMMPEPPKKDAKGHLVASVDILDTPCGQIAYQLGKYGFKFGISSRGEGDLIQDFSGEESVDPDTYTLNAFDLVLIPACEDARLQFNESLETKPTNRLRTILSEALENATDVDRKIMEEVLDELNIDDNWRYVETYEDNDIFFEPGTKKYIVGDLDSYVVLNSLKNAKEYIDRYNPDGQFFTEEKQNEEVYHLEYTYDTYDDALDIADNNLRGHINVKASSEEEAIEKAKKYLANSDDLNVRHFRLSNDRYTNVELVEEQVERDETKPATSASEILKNKPQPEKKVPEQPPEVNVNVQVPEKEGEIEEDIEHREDDEPEREKWDTDFHRLDVAYNHNFKQFDDMEADAGVIRDFTDDLEAQGKEYDIYKHTSDPGCTIFFDESLEEAIEEDLADELDFYSDEISKFMDKSKKNYKVVCDFIDNDLNKPDENIGELDINELKKLYKHITKNELLTESCDGWIAFYNGKKLEINKSEADNLYSAKQKAIKELKVPKSKLGLLAIKPSYNESLNEALEWDDLNGTEQSAVEAALVEINNGSTIEDAARGAVTMYNEENADPEYEDEDFYMEEADLQKVLMYLKTHSTDLPWDEPSDEQLAWEEENLEEDLDGTPQEFSALELRNMSSDELESLLDEAPIGSVIHNIYDNWWTKKKLKDGKEPTESIVEKHRGYKQNYYAPVPTKDRITWWTVGGSEKHKFDLIKIILGKNKYYTVSDGETFDLNEAKYTRDELFDKFGTDDLDIINAGNEEVVELAADGDGALVEQLQKILKHNKSLEEQVKKLQEKISVGYAKEIELKEELDSYKQKVTKLSEKTKEIKVLNEKLSKAENKLEESMKTAADNTSTLNESIKSKEQSNKKLEKNIANLNEAIDKKNIKIRSLNEEINKYKAEIDSKNTDIEQLKEQFETGQKDLEQLKNQYSKKLEKQNKIIEKYQRVAKNSVKRYIESQAVRLGVKSDEIINRLPKNYSFNDIDMICEDLQEYKFNMSNLPFGQYGLNEGMKVTAKNISKAPVENPADEITDYDLKIAEAFL